MLVGRSCFVVQTMRVTTHEPLLLFQDEFDLFYWHAATISQNSNTISCIIVEIAVIYVDRDGFRIADT